MKTQRTWWGAIILTAAAVVCGCSPSAPSPTPTPTPTRQQACLAEAVFGPASQSAYVLPYPVGTACVLGLSYCGPAITHIGAFGYDFLLPEGAVVTAARAGEVVAVWDQWPDSDSTWDHFNYVWILHDDDSVALYAHFQQRGVLVHVGERVTVGQALGRNGHSGTVDAHLHFGVYRSWPAAGGMDVPVNFRNAQGALDSRGGLQPGVTYTALPY